MAVKIERKLKNFENYLCSYGCNHRANYLLSNGKYCCGKCAASCPAIKNKKLFVELDNEIDEMCYCGCGNKAKFINGYGKYCCSNSPNKCPLMRLKNKIAINKNGIWNKGLTKETDDRVKRNAISTKKTRQKLSVMNELNAWNKGLTKETDDRVKKYSKSISKSKKGVPNYKKRKLISERRELCKSFINFKYEFKKVLWTNWTFPILERDNFKCIKCGELHHLEVHHLKPYRDIFIEAIKNIGLIENDWLNWSDIQIENLMNEILRLHPLEIGITLCRNCHANIDPYRHILIKKETNETK